MKRSFSAADAVGFGIRARSSASSRRQARSKAPGETRSGTTRRGSRASRNRRFTDASASKDGTAGAASWTAANGPWPPRRLPALRRLTAATAALILRRLAALSDHRGLAVRPGADSKSRAGGGSSRHNVNASHFRNAIDNAVVPLRPFRVVRLLIGQLLLLGGFHQACAHRMREQQMQVRKQSADALPHVAEFADSIIGRSPVSIVFLANDG